MSFLEKRKLNLFKRAVVAPKKVKKKIKVKLVPKKKRTFRYGKNFPQGPWPSEGDLVQLAHLRTIKFPAQRSPLWFQQRKGMLTASSNWKTAIDGEKKKMEEVILDKCGYGKKFKGNQFTEHGVKYEPVATRFYEVSNKTIVCEFGCVQHPQYPFLGASPDGITLNGAIMLEIKCPFSRKIIMGQVPRHYWIQIQGQLEVCNLTYCDYLECEIKEYNSAEDYFKDIAKSKSDAVTIRPKRAHEKGAVVTYMLPDGSKQYRYSQFGLDRAAFCAWEKSLVVDRKWSKVKVTFWKISKFNCVRVKRDPKWFQSVLPRLESLWNKILHYRKVGCESLLKNRKTEGFEQASEQQIMASVLAEDSEEEDFEEPEQKEDEKNQTLVLSRKRSSSEESERKPSFSEEDLILDLEEEIELNVEEKTELKLEEKKNHTRLENNEKENIPPETEKKVSPLKERVPLRDITKEKTKLFPLELSPEEWDTELLQAIALLKATDFILPHQIPLYPRQKTNYETYLIYTRIAGLKKTMEQVNSALSTLVIFPQKTLLNVPEDLQTISHQLNIWIEGLPKLLTDFNRGTLPTNMAGIIQSINQSAKKWNKILYPAWKFKFA